MLNVKHVFAATVLHDSFIENKSVNYYNTMQRKNFHVSQANRRSISCIGVFILIYVIEYITSDYSICH